MLKYLSILVMSATLLSSEAMANAVHLNPAQSPDTSSMMTFGKTKIPLGYYEFCQRYETDCRVPGQPGVIKLTEQSWRDIVRINAEANFTVSPRTDAEIYGVEERWEYPTTEGDCEDYVLLKRRQLLEKGFPAGALLITVARDAEGGGHAVLTVRTDLGDFILDNVEKKILLWKDAELYYLKRQSPYDPNRWESLVQG